MQEKSLIKQNILHYIDYKGITKYQFYKESGITRGVLDQNNGMSEENTARFLAKYKDINPTWLITGKGSMLLNAENNINTFNEPLSIYGSHTIHPETQDIPLFDLEAAAGIVSLFNDTHSNPIDFIRIPGIPKCDGAIHVTGDSMYPLLKSGDIVMYKKVMDPVGAIIFYGEMYIIAIEQDGDHYVVVKYVHKSDLGPDYVQLVSQNQHHDPIDVPKKSIRAMAIVRASIRINSMK